MKTEAQTLAGHLPPLVLAAQRLAGAVADGAHGQRRGGSGADFWQYRPAQPGEARTAIDWRQSARSQDLLVREREWTVPRRLWLWRDGSASMAWRSQPSLPSKAERALLLLLAVAEMARRGGEKVLAGLPAQPVRNLWQAACLLDRHDALPPRLPLRRGGAMLLISDFLQPSDQVTDLLRPLAAQGFRGHLLHILDPAEQIFPFHGRIRFEGCEGEAPVLTRQAGHWQQEYQQHLARHCQFLANFARSVGWSYGLHRTDQPATTALLEIRGHLQRPGPDRRTPDSRTLDRQMLDGGMAG